MSKDADPAAYSQEALARRVLEICQQRPFDGALWVVIRCPYCRGAWRLPPEEGHKLADAIRAGYGKDKDRGGWYRTVADEIDAGYTRDVAAEIAELQGGNHAGTV